MGAVTNLPESWVPHPRFEGQLPPFALVENGQSSGVRVWRGHHPRRVVEAAVLTAMATSEVGIDEANPRAPPPSSLTS